jgi:hypothetical protein
MPWHLAELLMLPLDAVHWSEAIGPALEYGFARSATRVDDDAPAIIEIGRPPTANALKVASIVTHLWLDQAAPDCRPDYGDHAEGCPHEDRRFSANLRRIALEAFGHDNGAGYAQTIQGLAELASRGTRVMEFDRETGRFLREAAGTLGEYRRDARTKEVSWAWGDSAYWGLRGGGFQRIPQSLVLGLVGRSFLVWEYALTHPKTRHVRPGRPIELVPALERMGLDKLGRPAKELAVLERAAALGNDLQDEWHLEVAARAHGGGWKLLVGRTRRSESSDETVRRFGRKRTPVRTKEDAIVREKGSVDGFLDISVSVGASPFDETRSSLRSETDEPTIIPPPGDEIRSTSLAAAVTRSSEDAYFTGTPKERAEVLATLPETRLRSWETSDTQRLRLRFIEVRGLRVGCETSHYAMVSDSIDDRVSEFENGGRHPDVGVDPFEALFDHDANEHPRKRTADPRLAYLKPARRKQIQRLLDQGVPIRDAAISLGLGTTEDRDTGEVARLSEWTEQ